jgi:hypothetical protein
MLNSSSLLRGFSVLFGALSVFLALEIYILTKGAADIDAHKTPFVFFFIALALGLIPMFASAHYTENTIPKDRKEQSNLAVLAVYFLITAFFAAYSYNKLTLLFTSCPISARLSDVIPLIQGMCRAFASGDYPYQPMGFPEDAPTYTLNPTYLPMQWMPYLAAEIGKFDPRYVSWAAWVLASFVLAFQLWKKKIGIIVSLFLMAVLLVFLLAVLRFQAMHWALTSEMLIMAYYLLLSLSLSEKYWAWHVLGISICLMSRFSLLFWVPFYFLVLFFQAERRVFWKTFIGLIAVCLVLYGPFLLKDPFIFFKAQSSYTGAALGEWTRDERPQHIYNGLGFAVFFHEKYISDLLLGVKTIQKVFFAVLALGSLALCSFFLLYWKRRTLTNGDSTLLVLGGLKFSLALFYAFVQVPYNYLFCASVAVSMGILVHVASLKYREKSANHNSPAGA